MGICTLVSISWKDSMIRSHLQTVFPNATSLRCIKHVTRNLRKNVQNLQSTRGFAKNEREMLKKAYPNIDWVWEIYHAYFYSVLVIMIISKNCKEKIFFSIALGFCSGLPLPTSPSGRMWMYIQQHHQLSRDGDLLAHRKKL